jgi:ADP-ribose pyrophosphatase YjhB (NUDIX family)
MNELNFNQMVIINNLIFKLSARFSELNTLSIPNDQFNYHIKKLVDEGYISKSDENLYSLTLKGKNFASSTDIYNLKIEKQSRIHLIPVCIRDFNGVTKYLIHRRKKHPYFDWSGFPSGKAKYGNFYDSEVIRELEEETGLVGTPTLKVIKHVLIKLKGSDEVVEDKQFFFYRIDDLQNELLIKTIEGENSWLSLDELSNTPNVYPDNAWVIGVINDEGIKFVEENLEIEGI